MIFMLIKKTGWKCFPCLCHSSWILLDVIWLFPSEYRRFYSFISEWLNVNEIGLVLPEAIAAAQGSELVADDAGEGRADQTALQRRLHQTARPKVDVLHRRVHLWTEKKYSMNRPPCPLRQLRLDFRIKRQWMAYVMTIVPTFRELSL